MQEIRLPFAEYLTALVADDDDNPGEAADGSAGARRSQHKVNGRERRKEKILKGSEGNISRSERVRSGQERRPLYYLRHKVSDKTTASLSPRPSMWWFRPGRLQH